MGQLDILARTHEIDELLVDLNTDGREADTGRPVITPEIKSRLANFLRVRDFATHSLFLPDNGSYRVYAELDRSHVVWNVVATPEFSFTPKQWCFPFAGCVPYRGYFSHTSALRFAETLKPDRLDVRVAGIAAYSTLGWFRDPVFSTQLRRSDTDIAALIFHELAHQRLYRRGDATFNESFATVVENEGVRRWLEQSGDITTLQKYRRHKARQEEFLGLLLKYRGRLETLYASSLAEEPMRIAKARDYAALRAEYVQLRKHWDGFDGYDFWFTQDINNAYLATVGLYHKYVPAFETLLARVKGDLKEFYREAELLSRLTAEERAMRLAELSSTDVTAGL